jgi:gliding motility-associated-like protein
MKNLFLHIRLLLFLLLLPFAAEATHIVGGELNYVCLGNNQYEVSLIVYRDCYNGDPNAYFDNPAYLGVYNSAGDLVDELAMPWLMVDDTLSPTLSNPCFIAPPDVCVHTTFYLDTLTLDPIPGGYTLYYQRCCRNGTINNIISPLSTGATFSITITEKAMLECNSNAQFNNWPPIYICVNEPIDFDHSATDPDGDSIVYKLCTPLDGATQVNPYPEPNEQTVPMPVQWQAPYDEDNMLGGIPLAIDPQTGFLSGTPNTVGQFVVGVCVEEYRDGELISITRRDFQYNVGVCGQPSAAFFAPDVQCGDLEVQFDNNSDNGEEYLWLFNDPANPAASSTLENPSYTYSDTGSYEVMLIVNPGTPCSDTAFQTISLQLASISADFTYDYLECSDSAVVQVTDLSIDNVSTLVGWEWTLSLGGLLIATSLDQNPVFTLFQSGEYSLNLSVSAANGCTEELILPLVIDLIDDVAIQSDSLLLCPGDTIPLNPAPNLQYSYSWSPPSGLDNPNLPNPLAFPVETTTYNVTVSDPNSICETQLSITVFVPEEITISLPPDTAICSPSIQLTASSNTGVSYLWAEDPLLSNPISQDSFALVTPFGETTYYLQVEDIYGCTKQDSIQVQGNGVNVLLPPVQLLCPGDTAVLGVLNQDPADLLSYEWSPDSLVLGATTNPLVLVSPDSAGTYWLFLNIVNQFDCQWLDSLPVAVLDTTPQLDFVFAQQCGGYSVQFTNTSINAPYYLWNFGDPSNPGDFSTDENPEYVYPDTGTYTVMLTVNADVPCKDTLYKSIYVGPSQIIVDFGWMVSTCSDSLVLSFADSSVNLQSSIISWDWVFSDGQSAQGTAVELVFYEDQLLEASLLITSDDGCQDSISQLIPLSLIQAEPEDSLLVCAGNPVELFPEADGDYQYFWTPDFGLDDPNAPNPTAILDSSIVYTVEILDVNGQDTCRVERRVVALVPLPINVQVAPADTVLCSEQPLGLQLIADQGESYLWSDEPDFSVTLGTEAQLTVNVDSTQWYYVQVSDSAGCLYSDSVRVGLESIGVEVAPPSLICAGDTFRLFSENLFPGQTLSYNWSPDSLILEGEGTASPLFQAIEGVEIIYQVENQFGCSLSGEVSLQNIQQAPPVSAFADRDTITPGQLVQLQAAPDDFSSYSWSPPLLLDDPFIFDPQASPEETVVFEVEVTDSLGCTNKALLRIVVVEPICEEPYVYLPNVFSPNGDGNNDLLRLRGNVVEEMHLIIYNRWGNQVFESRSQDVGWDGTYKGKELSSDVYGYYLFYRCINGQKKEQKGNITLLR